MRGFQRLAVIGWCLLTPAAAYAQASIAGTVRDASGGVLPGVTVEASSPVLIEKVRSAVTDTTGQYKIIDLRPGTYSVVVHGDRVQHNQTGQHRTDGIQHRHGERGPDGGIGQRNADRHGRGAYRRSPEHAAQHRRHDPDRGRASQRAQSVQPRGARAGRDADKLQRQQHPGRRRHPQHGDHDLLGARQPRDRSAADGQRVDRAQPAGVGVGEQFRPRLRRRIGGRVRVLLRHR